MPGPAKPFCPEMMMGSADMQELRDALGTGQPQHLQPVIDRLVAKGDEAQKAFAEQVMENIPERIPRFKNLLHNPIIVHYNPIQQPGELK